MMLRQPTSTAGAFKILAGSCTATQVPWHISVHSRSLTLQMLVSTAPLISSFLRNHQTLPAQQSILLRRLQPLQSPLAAKSP
jgi:hypothetical protein